MVPTWSLIFLILLHAGAGAVVTPFIYARKERSRERGLVLGALMGAFGGPLLLAALWTLVPTLAEACPQCQHLNPPAALVCARCGYNLVPHPTGANTLGELEIRTGVPQPGIQLRPSFLREIVETVLLIAAIYTFVNLATARFVVEGNSMLPNFNTDQFIIVSRLSYIIGEPQRGDVVVFHYPRQSDRDFIKRIIGLPGETVTIWEGQVYIDGKLIEEPYIEHFCRGHSCDGEWPVGEDQYFVLGDNRGASKDSQDFGPVDRKFLVGRAFVRYWPPEDWELISHHKYSGNGAPLPPTPTPAPTLTPSLTPLPSSTPLPSATVPPGGIRPPADPPTPVPWPDGGLYP